MNNWMCLLKSKIYYATSQYVFRSNRSTSMALLELIEEITSAVDNKKCTIGVFIDLKKSV